MGREKTSSSCTFALKLLRWSGNSLCSQVWSLCQGTWPLSLGKILRLSWLPGLLPVSSVASSQFGVPGLGWQVRSRGVCAGGSQALSCWPLSLLSDGRLVGGTSGAGA